MLLRQTTDQEEVAVWLASMERFPDPVACARTCEPELRDLIRDSAWVTSAQVRCTLFLPRQWSATGVVFLHR
jgi:adenine-specific DNA glycosylase